MSNFDYSMKLPTTNSEQDKQLILRHYRQLLRVSKWSREEGDIKEIRKAFEVAADAHKDMRRKSGEPYILHPLSVARIAAEEIGLGTTSIVCALLHDVVEDTEWTLEGIKQEFGEKVADIINGLTKISDVSGQSSSVQAENFRKMLLTLSDDVRVILIKLCDRLHNMRTLNHMSRRGQLKISSETSYLYAPLAHRLGLYKIKTELEDLALKYTQPIKYQELKGKLNASKDERSKYIRSFIRPIKSELEKHKIEYVIKSRPKSIFSILNKMEKQDVAFEQVYDLFAVRIIIDSDIELEKIKCWNVYSIVTSIFRPNPKRLRDWISNPKGNGYESLHTTVMGPEGKWVEVQIRTTRMDEIAEKGYAAHWKYKESAVKESGLDQWLTHVREILESSDESAIEFLDDFKLNLFSKEVFIFTPRGELKKLPQNATALDFAFEIHSEIGLTCIGAKVNSKLVPISHVLNNGDQVEILTSPNTRPSEKWLSFVVTTKAKRDVRHFLKEEERVQAEEGKEILKRKFRTSKIAFTSENLRHLVAHYKLMSEADLYRAIASEAIPKTEIKLKQIIKDVSKKEISRKAVPVKSQAKAKQTSELIIGDTEGLELEYSFAQCCNPIAGDPVMGFVTVKEGVKIHRTKCKNAIQLMSNYGHRIISARWAGQIPKEVWFEVPIKIIGVDSIGLVSKVTTIISQELKVNMKSLSFEARDGTFIGRVIVEIRNANHLDHLISNLQKVDKHVKVVRTDIPEEFD
jgi:GTP diphosphokinase / guanosine-3',5'-bis(diphosphate) 3'-diphosphatase